MSESGGYCIPFCVITYDGATLTYSAGPLEWLSVPVGPLASCSAPSCVKIFVAANQKNAPHGGVGRAWGRGEEVLSIMLRKHEKSNICPRFTVIF